MLDAMRDAFQRGDIQALLGLTLREVPVRSDSERLELSLYRLVACSANCERSRRLLEAGLRLADRTLPALAAVQHPLLLHALNWTGGLAWTANDVAGAARHMRSALAVAATVPPVVAMGLDAHHGALINSLAVAEVSGDASLFAGSFGPLARWLGRQEMMTLTMWQAACLLGRVAAGRQEPELCRQLTTQAVSVLAGFCDPAQAHRAGAMDRRVTINMLTDTIPLLAVMGMNGALLEWLRVLQTRVSQQRELTALNEFYLWTCLTEVAALHRAPGTQGFIRLVARSLTRVETVPAFYMDRVHRVLKRATEVQPRRLSGELAAFLTPAAWPYGAGAYGEAEDTLGALAAGQRAQVLYI